MKKIKIYRSKFSPIAGIIMLFAFMVGCMFGMYQSGGKSNNGIIIPAMIFALYAAISIIVFVIRKPKLIISDHSVMINTNVPWEVCFEDVDSFYPTSNKGQEVIGIRYKKDIEAPCDIYVSGLSKKPKDILNLLNQRLNNK